MKLHYHITALLVDLGFQKSEVFASSGDRNRRGMKSAHFFERHREDLRSWLLRAKGMFRARLMEAHPDHGGQHDEAAKLIAVYRRIQHLFREKGVTL